MVDKSFPYREDLHLNAYLPESPLCLGSIFAVVSIHNESLQEMGLSLFGPWIWIRQAHLTGLVGPHFFYLVKINKLIFKI